jgi:L-lysine 6-transaminase
MGDRLLRGLQELARNHEDLVGNARGRGLMCAVDLPEEETRDRVVRTCLEDGLIVLPSGTVSVRFRPALTISEQEIDEAIERLDGTLKKVALESSTAQPAN